MTITAKVIEDSIALSNGKRLTTLELRYPRFIHAEVLTHRDKSRNASSSRAIPVAKMIANTLADPAFFVHIGANQAGMQAHAEVCDEIKQQFHLEWLQLMEHVAKYVLRWSAPVEEGGYGIHKQVANRALEPWQHISVVMSGTEWDNMNELRDHQDAQPEFRVLQQAIKTAMANSNPRVLGVDPSLTDGWHLPYITAAERVSLLHRPVMAAKLSTARCARVSYLTHDGLAPDEAKDLALFERLVGAVPLHASPTEHPAYALPEATRDKNYVGFRQLRADIEAQMWADAQSKKPVSLTN